MTNQEMFDTVAAHLLAQGEQSLLDGECREYCAYRGNHGLKCAIGCLIPDERYDSRLEKHPAWSEAVQIAAGIKEGQEALADSLQFIHDSCNPLTWAAELNLLAKRYSLKGLSND